MRYMGSKAAHAKEILSVILPEREKEQWYVEPFAGSFSVISEVEGNRMASDSHFHLIQLFKAIQAGWEPPDSLSEGEYKSAREYVFGLGYDDRLPEWCFNPHLIGFIGFGCSYSGKWFGGYARGGTRRDGSPRNYCTESKNSLLSQKKKIEGVRIHNLDYNTAPYPENSIIYCDPPYAGTTKYASEFDSGKFWQWARGMRKSGHKVFVSEYSAPDDFECLWEKKVNNTLVKDTGSRQGIERLFRQK